jgi:hypothetical protein
MNGEFGYKRSLLITMIMKLMERIKMFSKDEKITSSEFNTICNPKNEMSKKARDFCEKLWTIYQPFADRHFLNEIRLDGKFQERFWEMYLGNALIEIGFIVSSLDKGPDFKVTTEGRVLWIEAICASNGAEGNPNSLVPLFDQDATLISDEKIVLRLRSAIEEKSKKIIKYLSESTINESEPVIIAINTGKIDTILAEEFLDYLNMSCFGKDCSQVQRDKNGKYQNVAIQSVKKTAGGEVSVNIFTAGEYAHISAVLISKALYSHYDQSLGNDFVLVLNPYTKNKLPFEILQLARKILIHHDDSLLNEILKA